MELHEEPKSIQVALLLSKLVSLHATAKDSAVVKVGDEKCLPRILTFQFVDGCEYRNFVCVKHEGPALSRFLLNEARVLAFLNLKK